MTLILKGNLLYFTETLLQKLSVDFANTGAQIKIFKGKK